MQLALDDGAPYKGAAWRGAGKQHALDGGALKGSGQGAAARRAARLRLEPHSGVSQLSALQSGAGGERSRWRATLSPPIGAPHAGVSQVRRQRGIAIANSFAIYDNAKGDCGLVKWNPNPNPNPNPNHNANPNPKPNPNPNPNPNSNPYQVKWCYNAMRLLQMPWLAGQAEVVAWTNARLGPTPELTPATTHLTGHLTRRWS